MSIQRTFIDTYANDVIDAVSGTGIFPSVKMAQMALETGWGKSKVGNNMFGIKAAGQKSPYWNGAVIGANTQEVIGGQTGTYNLQFRNYKSISDSIKDHTHFLQVNSRYKTNGVFNAASPEEQANALQKAGYATDPQYANKLIGLINSYNLKELDKKKR